jgi:hypothetical protein
MDMQRELTFLFTNVMPTVLVATALYLGFSLAACAVSRYLPQVEDFFASSTAKSVPLLAFTALVALWR